MEWLMNICTMCPKSYRHRMVHSFRKTLAAVCASCGWHLLLFGVLLGMLVGCDLIEYHPYDSRVEGETQLNRKNVQRIEQACAGKEQIVFAVLSDTQRWYDETRLAVNSINRRDDVDFVVHLGDLSDFGLAKEFEWMRDELLRLKMPCVCLIGNHDCLGTGSDVYRKVYGDPNFTFQAGDTHFVCVNTNAFEYDYSIAIPDFDFLRKDLSVVNADTITHRTVVAMHAAPGTDQFNNNVDDVFHEYLGHYPGLQFCLCGHTHVMQEFEPLEDGIVYHECGAAKGRKYLVFTLKKDGTYDKEVVEY